MNKQRWFGVLLLLLVPLAGRGQVNQIAVPALRVEPDPVATGRGFTGVADPVGARAVFWNPAGLAGQQGLQLGFSRFRWVPALDDELTYNYMMARYGNIGGHVTFLNLGSQSYRDGQGATSGDFASYELSVGLSAGQTLIPEKLSVGLGVRFVSSRLVPSGQQVGGHQTEVGNTAAMDLGVLYRPGSYQVGSLAVEPSVGLAITNVGGRVSYSDSDHKDALPTLLRLGTSQQLWLDGDGSNSLTVSAEISKLLVRADSTGAAPPLEALFSSWGSYEYYNGQSTQTVGLGEQLMIGLGAEYWYGGLLAVRAGYYREGASNGGREFVTGGGSLRYGALQVNASLAIPQGPTATD
ncbi:PorV/PorQ family protein, partial [Fodinibius salsisoli]